MLACSTIPDLEHIKYPVYASPKLDGIRCLAKEGLAMSRHDKLIPNEFIQGEFNRLGLDGLDGELMVDGDFNSVQSEVMSVHGCPDFYFNVFDCFDQTNKAFDYRLRQAQAKVEDLNDNRVRLVPQKLIYNAKDLQSYLDVCLAEGFEGLIVRSLDGRYKYGRSTLKQGWMLKIKLFMDDEAEVVGLEELMHNEDTSTRKKENLVPGNMLGALQVKWQGKEFNIGSGFDHALRREIWANPEAYMGRLVTFKYQELSKYGIPRFPTFKAFRDE
jgi:DNA ligase-1